MASGLLLQFLQNSVRTGDVLCGFFGVFSGFGSAGAGIGSFLQYRSILTGHVWSGHSCPLRLTLPSTWLDPAFRAGQQQTQKRRDKSVRPTRSHRLFLAAARCGSSSITAN